MHTQHPTPFWRGRSGLVLLGFLAIAFYFLWTEHQAHLIAFLPWMFLLACPLMHLFMHGGHGGHGSHGGHQDGNRPPNNSPATPGEGR